MLVPKSICNASVKQCGPSLTTYNSLKESSKDEVGDLNPQDKVFSHTTGGHARLTVTA